MASVVAASCSSMGGLKNLRILVLRITALTNIVLALWRISSGIRRKRGIEEIQDNLLIRADIKTLIPRECGICYSPGA
jgi:hypothetical protein